jgi:hypothetical protein
MELNFETVLVVKLLFVERAGWRTGVELVASDFAIAERSYLEL